jgi:hypothetical protein
MAQFAMQLIIQAALSYAVAYLLAPKGGGDDAPLDDSRTQPSVRGSLSPFLLGRLRVGPTIGFVGGRTITKEKQQ